MHCGVARRTQGLQPRRSSAVQLAAFCGVEKCVACFVCLGAGGVVRRGCCGKAVRHNVPYIVQGTVGFGGISQSEIPCMCLDDEA